MRGQPIPFTGREQVLEAYEQNAIWPWAIIAGGEVFMASEDDTQAEGYNSLDTSLQMLEKGGSQGIWTLRVYKDVPAGGISNTTKATRGFNFKLYLPQQSPYDQNQRTIADLTARCQKLESALQDKEDDEEEPEKVGGVLGLINGLMAIPEIKQAAMGWISAQAGKIFNMNQRSNPAQVAGIPGVADDDQVTKAEHALDVLIQHDPNVGDHLDAIAKIAATNPGLYKSLCGMIPKG